MFGIPLHKLLVHFPISLAVVGCGYDLWAVYASRPRGHRAASGLIRLSALSAVLALGTGLDLAGVSGLGSGSDVTGHAGLAILATVLLVTVTLLRYSREARSGGIDDGVPGTLLALEVVAVALVVGTTLMGHRIG